MKQRIASLALASLSALGWAGAAPQSVAEGVFAAVPPTALSDQDRTNMADQMGLVMRNGQVESDDEVCAGKPINPQTRLLDLNGDKQPEVLIRGGNACLSGMTGLNMWLFIKTGDTWRLEVDGPVFDVLVASSETDGWRDLHMLGRSHCRGLWTRASGKYEFARSINQDGSPCTP